jgi:hypothetical protein
MRIEAGVGDLVQRIGDDQAQVGYSVAGQSGGRVMPSAIHIVHMEEMRSTRFLVWPQNKWLLFVNILATKPLRLFLGLSLKTKVDGLVIWVSKSPRCFLGLSLKTRGRRFVGLHLKIDEQMKMV